jgi:DnaK suppressor protein
MKPEIKKTIAEVIDEHIQKIRDKLPGLKEQTRPISPDNAIGRLSRMEAMSERSVNEATYKKAQMRLEKLMATKVRVHDDDYGECLECGEEIALKRLQTLPESTLCMNCLNERKT